MKQLDVYSNDSLLGYLRDEGDKLQFCYSEAWLNNSQAFALSSAFPLTADRYQGHVVLSYFDNLLPEGSVRNFIAQSLHISAENVFGLLARFGGDTAGTLSFVAPGAQPSNHPQYLPIDPVHVKAIFKNSRGIPFEVNNCQARMSLSGVQDKMTLYMTNDGQMYLPLANAPSSHIVKPSVAYRNDLPDTALNETLVMLLAKAIGLDVPKVQYDSILDAMIIERYDRVMGADGYLGKLHQNDLCQLSNMPAQLKYESEGGMGLKDCVSVVLQHSSKPALDTRRLIDWVIFNLSVGNMDSHAKNLSMLTVDGSCKLSPFYDMACTTVYPNLSKRFSFKIGGENHPDWMMQRHWVQFAEDVSVKLSFIQGRCDMIANAIKQALPDVANELAKFTSNPARLNMIGKVETEINRCTKQVHHRIFGYPLNTGQKGVVE